MSEKFCLKWNDFHSNVSKSFGMFRNEDYLHDVTLVSDDHHQVSAHKLVLSACSEYFKDIFRNNNKLNVHPLLCLSGISSDDLKNIVDYIYNGEVQIFQEDLDRFLSIAQRLKLEGLIGENDPPKQDDFANSKVYAKKEDTLSEISFQDQLPYDKNDRKHTKSKASKVEVMDKTVASFASEDLIEVNITIEQHIDALADGKYKCKFCGKIASLKHHIKNHIETHLEGLSLPCQLCDKTFRSRNTLFIHKTRYHK